MICCNKGQIRVRGNTREVIADICLLSNTVRRTLKMSSEDFIDIIKYGLSLDPEDLEAAKPITIIIGKGSTIFNLGNN